jgi:nitrite reductase/ring-hydroxylating ferredoxin subunit
MREERIALAEVGEVAPGDVKRCLVPGFAPFALYNLGGEFFVTEDTCSHGMASLADGFLDGDIIECPFHGGAFNVRTGEPAERPCVSPIGTFPAIVEHGTIWTKAVRRADPRLREETGNERS